MDRKLYSAAVVFGIAATVTAGVIATHDPQLSQQFAALAQHAALELERHRALYEIGGEPTFSGQILEAQLTLARSAPYWISAVIGLASAGILNDIVLPPAERAAQLFARLGRHTARHWDVQPPLWSLRAREQEHTVQGLPPAEKVEAIGYLLLQNEAHIPAWAVRARNSGVAEESSADPDADLQAAHAWEREPYYIPSHQPRSESPNHPGR